MISGFDRLYNNTMKMYTEKLSSRKLTERVKKFKDNERVKLPAIPEDGIPEEYGVIVDVEDDDMYVVKVDDEYRDDHGDDGRRKVHADGIQKLCSLKL